MLRFKSKMTTPANRDGLGWFYVQPQTQKEFHHHSFPALMGMIQNHRARNGLDLSPGWEKAVEDEMCSYNNSESEDPDNPQPYESALVKHGRALWAELHAYRQTHERWLPMEAEDFVRRWEARIPNFSSCACREHYHEIRANNPPAFGSYEEFHAWTIRLHNAVNVRLGKPMFEPTP